MNTEVKPQPKMVHRDFNLGVVIIFIIITMIFLLALTQSNYSKELFSQRAEMQKLNT
jgi:hypothetical protein